MAYFERVRDVYRNNMRPNGRERTTIVNAELDVSRIEIDLEKIISSL